MSNPNPTPPSTKTDQPGTQPAPILGLPAPSDATPASEAQTSFKLDHLGPVIVNTDGTISRIAGWTEMTELEKQRSLRLLAKRNNARMQALRDAEGKAEADAQGQGQASD
ncbi:hypothetical protein ACQY0O_001185 [Thecaphora frezii]